MSSAHRQQQLAVAVVAVLAGLLVFPPSPTSVSADNIAMDCNTSIICQSDAECVGVMEGTTATPTCFEPVCCAVTHTTAPPTSPTTSAPCVDQINPQTGTSDCASMASKCQTAPYVSLMQQQCPVTCGYCGGTTSSTSSSSCVDLTNPSTGTSDCPGLASLCTSSVYLTLMQQQCPKTCGFCNSTSSSSTSTSTSCVDLTNPSTGVSDCPNRTSLCTNSAYLTLMKQQCPKTCGFCTSSSSSSSTSSSTSTSCADLTNPSTGVSDCAARASLCTNSAYTTLMQQQCPKTCGFCTGR